MTDICVTLTESTAAAAVERMKALSGIADLFEVRGDLFASLDLLTPLRAKTKPLIFTCRPIHEGGRWPDEHADARRLKLLEAVRRGYDYVDVELSSGFVDVMMEKAGNGLIVSSHDLEGTPENLDGLYERMSERGADVAKIAVTPHSIADVGRFLAFVQRATSGGGPPLVAIALGQMGLLTRVLGGRFGAPFMYASAAEGAEAAAGQIPAAVLADLYRVRNVGPDTRAYAIVGRGVAHSISPTIHNRAFEARDVDAVYVPLEVDDVGKLVEALPHLGLAGFSVTRPYKTDILAFVQEAEESAAFPGTANTIVVTEDGTLKGSSTDGLGVVAPLKKRVELKGRRAVILGAGGAARAAAFALSQRGVMVTLLARDPERAAEAAEPCGAASGALADVAEHEWDILVNATPVGSLEFPDLSPVPADAHRPGSVVLDMVYTPASTRLLRDAELAGCTVIGGLEMLVAQAVGQFETWTGQEAPIDIMEAAARDALRARG